jgi:hypothetical protein
VGICVASAMLSARMLVFVRRSGGGSGDGAGDGAGDGIAPVDVLTGGGGGAVLGVGAQDPVEPHPFPPIMSPLVPTGIGEQAMACIRKSGAVARKGASEHSE